MNLVEQQREVEFANIDVEAFVKDVNVDAAQEKAFYDANAAAFKTPEEAKFEYVVLTQDALLAQVAVTPEEVKAQYDSAAKTYRQEEQRQAAHILIAVKPDAQRGGARRGEEDRRRDRGAGEGQSREVRRAREAALAGSRLGAAGRRPRQQPARHDGEGVRRRGVRDEARRDRGPGRRASSAIT